MGKQKQAGLPSLCFSEIKGLGLKQCICNEWETAQMGFLIKYEFPGFAWGGFLFVCFVFFFYS